MSHGQAIGIYYINGIIGAVCFYFAFASLGVGEIAIFFALFVGGLMPIMAWALGYVYLFRWYQRDPSKVNGFMKFCGCMYSIVLFIPAYYICAGKYERGEI